MAPGWLIGYLVKDDGEMCTYRMLPIVSLTAKNGSDEIDAVVMTPTGTPMRADDIPGRAFAAGPDDDVRKIALAHAVTLGRSKIQVGARAAA